jgi:hypothetical protein
MTVTADPEAVRTANAAVSLAGLADGDGHALAASALARLVGIYGSENGVERVGLSFAAMSSQAALLVVLSAIAHLHGLAFPPQESEQT